MSKQLLRFILLSLLCSGCGKEPHATNRLLQPSGKFSYITPEGWLPTKPAGLNYTIVSSSADAGIKPNIFVTGVFPGMPILDLLRQIGKNNCDTLRNYTILTHENFTTDSGMEGFKITATHQTKEALLLTAFHYFIQDSDRALCITCTCADSTKQTYEPLFDNAIKSLQSEP
jgi:hypothetical protein